MSKLTKVIVCSVGVAVMLAVAHAWLNLGFDPLVSLGLKEKSVEEASFRVGFLPVT